MRQLPSQTKAQSEQKLDRERLQLEKEKLRVDKERDEARLKLDKDHEEERLKLDKERLEIDRIRANSERRFVNRHLGTFVTLLIAAATAFISWSQIEVAQINKDKELELISKQKERDIQIQEAQQDREWKFKAANFVVDNAEILLGKDEAKRKVLINAMLVAFPGDINSFMFDRLERVAEGPEKKPWRDAKRALSTEVDSPRDIPLQQPVTKAPANLSIDFQTRPPEALSPDDQEIRFIITGENLSGARIIPAASTKEWVEIQDSFSIRTDSFFARMKLKKNAPSGKYQFNIENKNGSAPVFIEVR